MSKKRRLNIIVMSILLPSLLILVYLRFRKLHEIANNPVLVLANITRVSYGKPPSVFMSYEYCYDHAKFYNEEGISEILFQKYKNGMEKTWIVIAKTDPQKSEIMQDDEMFSDFNVDIKDTINVKFDSSCYTTH